MIVDTALREREATGHPEKLFIVSRVTVLLALAFLYGPEAIARTYSTNFRLTEDPISEGGNWINGKTVGLDWSNVSTTSGLAFGRQSGSNGYDDSTALLNGTWRPDQSVTATVHSVNQTGGSVYEEVEIRLRSSLSAHSCTGYEITYRVLRNSSSYVQIVRWNGLLGSFTYLADMRGSQYGISDGDVLRATVIGSVITAYLNNVQVAQAIDNTYSGGSPGMGFFLQGATGVDSDFGFASFTASDRADTLPPSSPKSLHTLHCAHGSQTLEECTGMYYVTLQVYTPSAVRGVRFDDPAFNIQWPLVSTVVSKQDRNWPLVEPRSHP